MMLSPSLSFPFFKLAQARRSPPPALRLPQSTRRSRPRSVPNKRHRTRLACRAAYDSISPKVQPKAFYSGHRTLSAFGVRRDTHAVDRWQHATPTLQRSPPAGAVRCSNRRSSIGRAGLRSTYVEQSTDTVTRLDHQTGGEQGSRRPEGRVVNRARRRASVR
ncbi:hypothetical protein BV20DRAFT_49305 [Pilatotrama ljubarskyi]|nr:hypothetical protein BV20DRAFT_49305 [Pilatotrama ljubarskyi]